MVAPPRITKAQKAGAKIRFQTRPSMSIPSLMISPNRRGLISIGPVTVTIGRSVALDA
jgi:hypothetical protein